MKFGLNQATLDKICAVFASFNAIEQVIIYGSRAKGNYKPGSDIDLTIKGKDFDLHLLNKVSTKLDDLLLPYTFDLSIYDYLNNPDLIEHINRVGVVLYEKGGMKD